MRCYFKRMNLVNSSVVFNMEKNFKTGDALIKTSRKKIWRVNVPKGIKSGKIILKPVSKLNYKSKSRPFWREL